MFDHHEMANCLHGANSSLGTEKARKTASLQLQQGQIGVAIIGAILALLRHVVLEHGRGFRIVSIEAIENGINVLRSIWCMVKGDTHGDGELECVDGSFVFVGLENGFMIFCFSHKWKWALCGI